MSRSYLTALGRENAKEFYEDNRVIEQMYFLWTAQRDQNHHDNLFF